MGLAPRTFASAPRRRRDAAAPQPSHPRWAARARPGCPRKTVRAPQNTSSRDLRDALNALLKGADLPDYVPGQIGASWRRSIESGLNPSRVDVPFDPDVDSDGLLVKAARPVLDELASDLAGTRVAVLLTNERGQVVDRRTSEPGLLALLDRIRLAPGYVYAEDVVGTNGMGTALARRVPSAVEGDEHFADALTTVACAGAPITDPRSGRALGVVDLTSLAAEGSGLMLPLATRAAREIEQRVVNDNRLSERLLIQRFLQERRGAKGPLVVLGEAAMIANAAADRLVEPQDEPTLRECANRLGRGEPGEVAELVLSGGTEVAIRRDPDFEGGLTAGAVLRLTPIGDRRPGGSRRGYARFGWESLTDTERSVIDLVAQGLSNREAGERLFLSHHTVGFHLRSIYRKLGVTSRVDLTRLAVEHQR
jgi:DNA-binding CsgD family transcriptional regulator